MKFDRCGAVIVQYQLNEPHNMKFLFNKISKLSQGLNTDLWM